MNSQAGTNWIDSGFLLFVVLVLFAGGCSSGNTVSNTRIENVVEGQLVDMNGRPVSQYGVKIVRVDDPAKAFIAITDFSGHFEFLDLPTGKYNLYPVKQTAAQGRAVDVQGERQNVGTLTVPMAVKVELDKDAAKTINPEAEKAINQDAAQTLNPEAAKTLNAAAAKTLNPEAARTISREAAQEINPGAAKTINPEAAQTINGEAAKAINPDAARTINPEAAKTINPAAARVLDPQRARILTKEQALKLTPEEAQKPLQTAVKPK
jgi:hypothetical protein